MTEQQLAAGLAALKQKEYQQAIALLSSVVQTPGESQQSVLRAQMGLVVAYQKTHQMEAATEICQQLQRSQVTQVRQWAKKWCQQRSLKPTHPATEKDPTGFVPLEKDNNPPPSPTGFVPLEKNPKNQKHQKNQNQPANGATQETSTGAVAPDKTSHQQQHSAIAPSPPAQPKKAPPPQAAAKSTPPPPPPPPPKPQSDGTYGTGPSDHRTPTIPASSELPWKHAPKGKKRRAFKLEKKQQYRLVQIATVAVCFWLVDTLVDRSMSFTNHILYQLRSLPFVNTLQIFYDDPKPAVAVGLLVLFALMPWLWDGILRYFYGLEFTDLRELDAYSIPSRKFIQRQCRARNCPLPKIGILPLEAPVAMAYGHLPRTTRLVVSRGLLEQLDPQEIAAVYAGEWAHFLQGDGAIVSWGTLLCQIPYLLYWKTATWGDSVAAKQAAATHTYEKSILGMSLFAAVVASVAGYGLYWLGRWPFLLLSRWRCLRSDRLATNLTNDPNALSRALVKISLGMARDIQTQGQTHWLLESCDLLFPIGCRQAIGASSSYLHHRQERSQNSLAALFPFDCNHPYRRWLLLNNSHPLLGERLQYLARYAQMLRVEPEFDPGKAKNQRPKKAVALTWNNLIAKLRPIWQSGPLYWQGCPYFGALLGLGMALCLILVGWIGQVGNVQAIEWLWSDRFWIAYGAMLAGFSLGSFWRTNALFPDIEPTQAIPSSAQLPRDAQTMPVASPPVALQGRLLGRRGLSNLLGQDLILHCHRDLVKLNGLSPLDIYKFFLRSRSQQQVWDWIGCPIEAIGWFRQGATPWIDVETWQSHQQVSHSRHPIWYTLVAAAAAIWATYWLATGGI
ncbi:M48 family metalloprotease [Geitlerinema sp. PCC 9228]|uniref:M48 family metalloprotease n=1 Tax=Geitlerinema sp. PCC 9228 TaxID=111611 RepID=UPI0008F9A157|nr:M48 family metalloprotease [Geitlerinema sp. PCC 9228]